jgi:hypothetical protein
MICLVAIDVTKTCEKLSARIIDRDLKMIKLFEKHEKHGDAQI